MRQAVFSNSGFYEIADFSELQPGVLKEDKVAQTVADGHMVSYLNALGHMGVVTDDQVCARIGNPLKGGSQIGRG